MVYQPLPHLRVRKNEQQIQDETQFGTFTTEREEKNYGMNLSTDKSTPYIL